MKPFLLFLEQEESHDNDFKQLESHLDSIGVKHSIGHNKRSNSISVYAIEVPKEKRNSGIGTSAMRAITAHADKHAKKVTLSPSADFGGSKARLIPFYKRLGFVENKGRNKDYSISDTMYREPKK